MKTKNFDCVEMKHLGAEKIREKIQDMTREQEAAFWNERTQALRQHQANVKQRKKSDKSAA
jgi:hypothetical protein